MQAKLDGSITLESVVKHRGFKIKLRTLEGAFTSQSASAALILDKALNSFGSKSRSTYKPRTFDAMHEN